jgi:hypothetical protein
MYFILYNFVQPPNLPEIQFHFTGAGVTHLGLWYYYIIAR